LSYLIIILALITTIYFCAIVWVIIGFIKIKKIGFQNRETVDEQNISIIIPVRNEEINIEKCLQSIQNQNYNTSNVEVIIINDHSTDNTEKFVNDFIKGSILQISLYALSDKTSKKEALKLGIEKSKYNLIATTDADCILPENWLKNTSLHINDGVDMLLGPIIFEKGNGFLYWFQTLDMLAIQGIEFGTLHYQKPILNNAANLSYLKSTYKYVGGFDTFNTPSGDDVFLLEKFKSSNKKITGLLAKDFIVETPAEKTLSGFFNQRLRWSSKAKYYSSKLLLFFSSIVLIQNILLLFICVVIPLVEKYRLILIILFLTKWLIDFILLFLVACFYDRNKALLYFIPVQLIYPIYIIVVWIASITTKYNWKGREFNG